jgi:ATP-dependent exoDNAse (exonuclease V) alpha subunit
VFGVAPSAAAAEVLAVDTGADADTVDKLLVEHTLGRQPQHRYDLPRGALVIVDEAAMVSTPKLAALAVLADWKGWRIALVGDPLQFSAVGRSGMFAHLVAHHDGVICLDGVHRFHHDWERDANLRLRRGDDTVLDLYDRHGRIHGGIGTSAQRAITRAWIWARERRETVAMMAPTTDGPTASRRRRPHRPRQPDCLRRAVPVACRRRGRHPQQRPSSAHGSGSDGQEP